MGESLPLRINHVIQMIRIEFPQASPQHYCLTINFSIETAAGDVIESDLLSPSLINI